MWLPLHDIKNFIKLMTRSLVQEMLICMNMFPSKNLISSDLIPAAIILGSTNLEYNNLRITCGSYA